MHEKESMSLKMEEATHQGEWAASGMTTGSKETGSLFPQAHRTEFCQRDWACVHFSKCLVTHTHVHTHTHTHTTYTHIYAYTCTHIQKYSHTLYTHVHTHTHTHTHTHPPSILSEPQRTLHTHQVTKSTCLVLKPQFITRAG